MERRLMAAMDPGTSAGDLRLNVAAALFWDPDARGGDHQRQQRAGPQKKCRRTFWPRAAGGGRTAGDTPAAIEAAGFAVAEQRRARVASFTFVTPVAPHALGRARRA
jgi:hypothetical protein